MLPHAHALSFARAPATCDVCAVTLSVEALRRGRSIVDGGIAVLAESNHLLSMDVLLSQASSRLGEVPDIFRPFGTRLTARSYNFDVHLMR